MAGREMRCFLVYAVSRRYRRSYTHPYRVEGLQATVHATSMTAAEGLLRQALPGLRLKLSANPECQPALLEAGYHCTHHLIAKDVVDPTPLGAIPPNSPEWHERQVPSCEDGITPRRQAIIDKMKSQRRDLYD